MTAWPTAPLGELVVNLDSRRVPLNESERDRRRGNGCHPYFGANGELDRIDEFIFDEPILCVAEDGGSWGRNERCAYVVTEKCWVNNHAHVLAPADGSNLRFLAHYLNRADLSAFVTGSTRGKLTRSALDRIPVPNPPPPEQRRIAAILDAAEALREKRRQAVDQHLRLLDRVFEDIFGDFEQNPHRWPLRSLGDLISDTKLGLVRSSKELSNSFGTPYLRMNAITSNGYLSLSDCLRTEVSSAELKSSTLVDGDFLFNTRNSRELVGKSALFAGAPGFVFNNNILRIRFVSDVDSRYVWRAFQTRFIQRQMESRKSGTTSVFAIYHKDLATVQLPVPSDECQQRFSAFANAWWKMFALLDDAANQLKHLNASLQQRAFRRAL